MSSAHAFYTGSRIVFETASILLALKLGRDVHADRGNLPELWRAPRRYRSSRVLRVVGLLSSLVGIIIHIDFYGVFGILHPQMVVAVLWVGLASSSVALHVTLYHELVATLPFIGILHYPHKGRIQAAVALGWFAHIPLYCATFFLDNRVLLLTGTLVAGIYAAWLVSVVNAIHCLIRRYHKAMKAASLKSYIGQSARAWNATLRKWRTYTILVSLVLVCACLFNFLQVLLPSNVDRSFNDLNSAVDPTALPNVDSVMFPFLMALFALAAAIRSHRNVDELSSKASGSDRCTKSSLASSDHKLTAKSSSLPETSCDYELNVASVPEHETSFEHKQTLVDVPETSSDRELEHKATCRGATNSISTTNLRPGDKVILESDVSV